MDVEGHRKAAIARALEGQGQASPPDRETAFAGTSGDPMLTKVAEHAYEVTAEDIAAAKQHHSEDEIFELVVCAAYGKASRQLAAALAAIDEVG
ncbi:MAG TPA: hypothetical protein VFQ65_29885 [Kofleriaceae bacterium]|nr:hypothetical protein [Kofleriaceae bacterium]